MTHLGSVSGHFELNVYDTRTGCLTKHREFNNLITDIGLRTYMGSGEIDYGAYGNSATVSVGKGTNTPDPSDTTLGNHFATAPTNFQFKVSDIISGVAPDWVWGIRSNVRFDAGTFNGDAITEVGVCGRGNGKLWSRALIVDEQGRPSSITIMDNEFLDVIYTLYYHPLLDDTAFRFNMDGVTYSCVARACRVNQSPFSTFPFVTSAFCVMGVYGSQNLGQVTEIPATSDGYYYYANGVYAFLPYDNQSPFTRNVNSTLSRDIGNFDGGVGSVHIAFFRKNVNGIDSQTQISFTPKLPKDANTDIVLTLSKTISRWTPPTP